jgi:hypothetical protein
MHPWYLLILLAFVPFESPGAGESSQRWWCLAPWLYLSGTLALSYLAYLTPHVVQEPAWVRLIEWLPTWGLVVTCSALALRRREIGELVDYGPAAR